jgi:hypothetical protein
MKLREGSLGLTACCQFPVRIRPKRDLFGMDYDEQFDKEAILLGKARTVGRIPPSGY